MAQNARLQFPVEIQLAGPAHSEKGRLRVLEFPAIPEFSAKRMYWIADVPPGASRGHHAHKTLRQVFFMVSGSCTLKLQNPSWSKSYALMCDALAVYCPAGFWREISDFSPGSVLGVLASDEFDDKDYIRDWDGYCSWHREST